MPPSIDELALQLSRETDHRERAMKYAHNMMEDLKEAFAEFRMNFGKMQGGFEQHIKDDQKTSSLIGEMKSDVETVKRLVWMGLGGLCVVAGIVALIGGQILHLLAK